MQAFSDPRDFAESEAVVDLDELDIFDDLDEYVDLDKVEVIQDVQLNDKGEEEKTAGDELRDLIKGRMKQAAEMPVENQRNTAGLGAGAAPVAGAAVAASDKAAAAGGGMGARHKFVGAKAQGQTVESSTTQQPPVQQSFIPKIPPEMRKHCMILGIPTDPELLTKDKVMLAWKNQIASPGVHPDLGGDTEAAIALNTAKDAWFAGSRRTLRSSETNFATKVLAWEAPQNNHQFHQSKIQAAVNNLPHSPVNSASQQLLPF